MPPLPAILPLALIRRWTRRQRRAPCWDLPYHPIVCLTLTRREAEETCSMLDLGKLKSVQVPPLPTGVGKWRPRA